MKTTPLLLSLLISACANVAPYQREILADPIMRAIESKSAYEYDQHLHRARSQGLLGAGTSGGGCGCEQ